MTRETTPGGSEVFRHQHRDRPMEVSIGDPNLIEDVTAHFERHIGPVHTVFHEIVSDLIHLDVHIIQPSSERPWYTLFTTGMAERPMSVPAELRGLCPYMELMLRLDPNWKLDAIKQSAALYWPIRGLKELARLPHEYNTWLGKGHTVPNGDPPEPFAPNTRLACWLVVPPLEQSETFAEVERRDGRLVNIMQVVPLYPEEVRYKLDRGGDALLARFAKTSTTDIIFTDRPSAVRKRIFGMV